MKVLDKFPISLECHKYEVVLDSTTPRLATFVDVVVLDSINRLSGKLPKKYGESFQEVLHKHIDIPESMFYLFEERLQELVNQELVEYTISSDLKNSIHSFTLSKEGKEVLKKKRIPGEWKKVSSNVLYDQFNDMFFDKSHNKRDFAINLDVEMLEDDVLMKYIEKNKTKLFRGVNSHTVFREDFGKELYDSYRNEEINLVINNNELQFYHKNEKVLNTYINELESIEYKYPVKTYKKLNLNEGNIRVYEETNNIKSGVSNLPFNIQNCHSAKELELELGEYDLIGVDDQNREFLYNYSCYELNGSIVPLEQFIYNKNLYHGIMDKYLRDQISKLGKANKKDKESILDTIFMVAGKQTIQELTSDIIEVVVSSSKSFIDIEHHLSTIKERSKSFNIKGINNKINERVKILIDNEDVIKNTNLDTLFDFSTKYQIKKSLLVSLIVKYVNVSDKELVPVLVSYVNEDVIVKELKLLQKYNDALIDGNLKQLDHELNVYSDYLSIFNSFNNLKDYLGINDMNNYVYPKGITLEELKSYMHKYQKDFKKVKDKVDNKVRKLMRQLDDICSNTLDYLYVEDVKSTIPVAITMDYDSVDSFIESKNYKIAAYILRSIIEDNTDKELQGIEKFKARFGKQHKKPYGHWRYINQVLHGEIEGESNKLTVALDFFKEAF